MAKAVANNKCDDPDDETLIVRIAAQDRAAFRLFADRYSGLVFSVAWRMTGHNEAAEDITQDSFLKVWQHANSWDSSKGASVRTWLCRITSNLCIDRYRRKREIFVSEIPMAEDEKQDTSQTIQDQQRSRIIEQEMQSLPDRQRAALILFHYEHFSVAETASALGTSIKGAENLLYRARQSLKQKLMAYKEAL